MQNMKRISSRSLAFTKKVFPVLWFGILAAAVAVVLLSGAFVKAPFAVVVPCIMAVLGYLLMRKLVWDMADEVYDCGDHLLVRAHGQEERVALSNIMNVNASTLVNPPRITLRLVTPGRFGNEIAFSPVRPATLNPFARNAVADDLIVRAHKARSGAAFQGRT